MLANAEETKYDYAGLVISDRYTNEYEIGGDLAKMRSNGQMSVYTLSNNVELAFNTLSTSAAEQSIPVGIAIPSAGDYTFSIDAVHYAEGQVEHMLLTDNVENVTVDLVNGNYTFHTAEGVNNTRFVISATPKAPGTTTGETLISDNQGEVFAASLKGGILVAGMSEKTHIRIYDAQGALVTSAEAENSYYFNLPAGVYLIKTYSENKQNALCAISF